MTDDISRHLPLEDLHRDAGARFCAFAGWAMPIAYPAGVMQEHRHTRENAGLFDISHMRLFTIAGTDASAFIDRVCPLEAEALALSQSKYSLLLDDKAGILDDVIVTRLDDRRFVMVVNAGTAAGDEAHLRRHAEGFDVAIVPLDRVFLALQGPAAQAAIEAAGIDTRALSFMHGIEPRDGWFMSRSGYTGEDGFEIALPEAEARTLLATLLRDERVLWIGLGARDSLRLEAGLCLHGSDIAPGIDPVEAALMWAIPKSVRDTGRFVGAEALRQLLARGPSRKRVGLKPAGRQPVRGGAVLFDADNRPIGRVTSGGFGPTVGHPVAMGYVDMARSALGSQVFAAVRGAKVPMDVHALPFTPHRYHKG